MNENRGTVPLRGFVLDDSVVLQMANWQSICQYEVIEFHLLTRDMSMRQRNGSVAAEIIFDNSQVSSGDLLCLAKDSTKEEISQRILDIVRGHWNDWVQSGKVLPSQASSPPNKVVCSLDLSAIYRINGLGLLQGMQP